MKKISLGAEACTSTVVILRYDFCDGEVALHRFDFDLECVTDFGARDEYDETLDTSDPISLLCYILNLYVIRLPGVYRGICSLITEHIFASKINKKRYVPL